MLIATLAALIMAAQPAAVDPDIACVLGRVPAAARATLLAEVKSGELGPVRDAFRQAAASCGKERSWNAERTDRFGLRAAMLALKLEVGGSLKAAGIPLAPIERWVAAQPEGLDPEKISDAAALQLREQVMAANVAGEVFDANGEEIGMYIAMLLIDQQLKAELR